MSMAWHQSNVVIALASVLFPPAGLVLLWLRPATGRLLRLAGTAAILAIGAVELFKVYGLRAQLDGSGAGFIYSFRRPIVREDAAEAAPPSAAAEKIQAPAAAPVAKPEPAAPQSQPPPAASAPVAAAAKDYWTDYRGPSRLGIYDETPILTSWPSGGLKRLWKAPAGGGYSSFTVAGGRAFTIEQRNQSEVVAAIDVATGRQVWANSWNAHFSESMGGDGPRTTPVFEGGRVYALGAEGELRVLDAATGKVVWNKNILQDNGANNLTWAMSASPLVVDDKVVVLPGGQSGKSVVAYNKLTGARMWSALDDDAAYASPIVATLAGQRQLLVVTARRVAGLTLDAGKLLWEFPWVTEYNVNATHPIVVSPGRFFVSSGYDHGAAVVELTPDGGGFATRLVWQNKRMKNKFNDSVLYQGHIYGLDEGILACIDIETGAQKWKGGRYGFGQLLLASGHLVVLSERGELALVKADPGGHKELAKFDAISGKTWNNPAIAGGVLLVRNTEEMAAFQLGR